MTHTSPFVIVVVGIALAACITDLRTRRIPNALTIGAAMAAIAVHAVSGGAVDALLSVGGWLTGVLLFLPFYALGGMGGGDVKLLGAIGILAGPVATTEVMIVAFLLGALEALARLAWRGQLFATLWRTARTLGGMMVPGKSSTAKEPKSGLQLRFGTSICVAVLLVLWSLRSHALDGWLA